MSDRRKTTIRIEIERTVLLARRDDATPWCARCGARTPMVRGDDAALVAGVDAAGIARLVREGRLHGTTGSDGGLAVCLTSLVRLP